MEIADQFMHAAPLPVVGLIVFGLLMGAMLLASLLRIRTKGSAVENGLNIDGYIVSGALGLVALLLAFTFGLAIDRFDQRRALTLTEANAIGTAYLRTQMVEGPGRAPLSRLLILYADNRLALADTEDDQTRLQLLEESSRLQFRLWVATMAAARDAGNETISRPLIEAVNETIDAGEARVMARRAHVPPRVLVVLLIYMMIGAFILGFVVSGSRWLLAPATLMALFASSYLLIVDIDRPTGGGVRETQSAMRDLIGMMRTTPPSSFDTPAVQP